MNIETIKLIIWDLDDTFWNGTLSEGGAQPIERNLQIVRMTTDCGIVNSICSKNEAESTITYLKKINIWDYFVFASINWENKGQRLKQLIDKMALRPQNVLFIDDNSFNLQEAKHYLPDLQVAAPDILEQLWEQVQQLPQKDKTHKRLKQYKVLETKAEEQSHFDNNEDFLFSSQIRVTIHHDCVNEITRLHELILRSNQLNYTKKRITEDELRVLLADKLYDCGYVEVKDRFGDYGIVGFYALKDNVLEHFVFSCRTMGQLIEQWVYAQLGFPALEVVGEVRTQLNKTDCPAWINQSSVEDIRIETDVNMATETSHCKILIKGPCDLYRSERYIKDVGGEVDTEFTYVDDKGRLITAYNHSVHILGLHEYTENEKQQIVGDCPFVDPNMLNAKFFTGNYDIIFLSSLIETPYGIYQKKGTNIKVVFGHKHCQLTNKANWESYVSDHVLNCNNHFTMQFLEQFTEQYEFVGSTTPESYVDFLDKVLQWLPKKTTLCIILGTTYPHNGQEEWAQSHRIINDAVKSFASTHPRLCYIDLDDIIKSENDFTDGSLTHYSARVYFEIAEKMLQIVKDCTGKQVSGINHNIVVLDSIVLRITRRFNNIFSPKGKLYRFLKPIYFRITRGRVVPTHELT